MADLEKLCLAAATAVASGSETDVLRPTILGSVDGSALTTLATNVPSTLPAADVELALASFFWILHVQACTVSKWRGAGSGPEPAVVVDCYSESEQWQMVLRAHKDGLLSPVSFREVVALHPLSAWHFPQASDAGEASGEVGWANHVHQKQALSDEDMLEALEARLARSQLRLSDLKNNQVLSLSFSPIVAFDFAKHSAASNLEALGSLAPGLTNSAKLLSMLSKNGAELRKAHCKALLAQLSSKLSKTEAAKVAGFLEKPPQEAIRLLGKCTSVPEAQGLAYWATSFDHDGEGLSFAQISKALKVSAKVFEDNLAKTPLRLSGACPVCAGAVQYAVPRFSLATKVLSFNLQCPACGHHEVQHRDGTWVKGPLSCSCASCVKRQREVSALHLPRVVLALEEALRAAHGLASKSVHAAVQKISVDETEEVIRQDEEKNPFISTEWDAKHAVYLQMNRDDEPAPVHHFEAKVDLGALRGASLDEAVQTLSSLGPTNIHFLEHTVRRGEEPGEPFAYLPDCLELLVEGDRLAPSELLVEWAKALHASGLLCSDRSKFKPLVLMPYGWLNCEFSSARQQEIETEKDLVVWREVPKAEALLLSLAQAVVGAAESDAYGETAVAAGYAGALEHGKHILEQAGSIQAPEAQTVLQHLAQGQSVSVESLRAARDALKRDPDASALFYAALLWNYSYKGTGNTKAPLGSEKWAVFSRTTVNAARESYALRTTVVCRRCSCSTASLIFAGASGSQDFWRAYCRECGHWEESHDFSYRYPNKYCDCQHCANAVAVALSGKSTATLVSELISHCVVEAHALSSKPASTAILEEADLHDLLEEAEYPPERASLLKKHALKATWKTLRFNTSVGMLRHLLPGYSFCMPSMQDLALLTDNHSPTMSRPAFRTLQQLLELTSPRYRDKHLRFRLPLCIVFPDSINEPKVPKRGARHVNGSLA